MSIFDNLTATDAAMLRKMLDDAVDQRVNDLREAAGLGRDDAWIRCVPIPTEALTREVRERFWSHIDKDGPTSAARPDLGPCWIWTRGKKNGYGRLRIGDGTYFAHRVSYFMEHGEIDDGLTVDHLCRVKACTNPAHMELVPILTNMRRAENSVSQIARLKDACDRGHPFTPGNTFHETAETGRPVRKCRTCRAEAQQRRKMAVKAAKSRPHLARPDRDTLERELRENSYTALSLKYGVTDTMIKKWARKMGIDTPVRRPTRVA